MDEIIDGVVIIGIQVDGGSSVNLKSAKTMEEFGLTQLQPTIFILRMDEQNCVKPMGVLFVMCIIIAKDWIPHWLHYIQITNLNILLPNVVRETFIISSQSKKRLG